MSENIFPGSLFSNTLQFIFFIGSRGPCLQRRKEVKEMWIYTSTPPYAFMA
jgi:hypothetical protein